MTRFRPAVLLLSIVMALAACGDDDAASTTAAAPAVSSPATSAQGSTVTSTAPSSTAAPGTTAPSSEPAPDPSTAEGIAALLDVFARTPLKLTYEFGSGGDQQVLTLVQDPAATPPINAILLEDGSRIISSADGIVICAPDASCFQAPTGPGGDTLLQGILGPSIGGYLTLAGGTDTPVFDVDTDTAEIAGRSGVCFTYRPTVLAQGPETEMIRQCVDAELGFTLAIEAQQTGGELENVMTLLSFGEPAAEDFEPTGPVTTIPQP